jgi:glutaminyl-peptide cyclotransferase
MSARAVQGSAGVRFAAVAFALAAALLVLVVLRSGAEPARSPGAARAAAPAATGLPRARVDRFDAPAALALVRRQVAFGQRPAGSIALRRLAAVLRPLLPAGRFEPLPGTVGRTGRGLRNLVGVLPGRRPALVIGAHYDSESHPRGFVGANDSAAGTAALIEVARSLGSLHRPAGARELRFVLFDGEEEPTDADNVDFLGRALRGSKAYVAAHRREVRALVLLDYIANRGLRLPREGSSDPGLWGQLRAAAASVGVASVFPASAEVLIYDDHTPFLRAGIPAIDLIDFSYRYADGLQDTVDKLDVRALDAVGESVVELVRRLDHSGF